jgi:hypothetical protein
MQLKTDELASLLAEHEYYYDERGARTNTLRDLKYRSLMLEDSLSLASDKATDRTQIQLSALRLAAVCMYIVQHPLSTISETT